MPFYRHLDPLQLNADVLLGHERNREDALGVLFPKIM